MAQGGPPQGGGQGRPNQMARLMEGITLTAEQQAKVDSISASVREEQMKLRGEMQPGTPPSEELRAKLTAITTKRNDAIKAVLTADQKAIFEKNLANMPPMGGQRPPR
jgi:periplasmic protein CpxP/Spy